jgi:RNA polymerase sigma-70 factor (ECF subfamily)
MAVHQSERDDRNIEAIAARYKSAIMAFFLRRVPDRSDAEDLTQDVFASLSRRADPGSIENVERYVFQVAANLLRDRARRARARPRIDSEGYADPQERLVDDLSPERFLIGRDAYSRFVEILQALPERPRMVFILNRFEEMTGKEIAAALGVSQRLVEKDIGRVLALLRERLP